MKNKTKFPPFLEVSNGILLGVSNTKRKPLFENAMCESVGLVATCNCCDRIIFEDENYLEQYKESGGYCKDCNEEGDGGEFVNITNIDGGEFRKLHQQNFEAKFLNGGE